MPQNKPFSLDRSVSSLLGFHFLSSILIFSLLGSSRLRVTGTILVWSPPSLPVTSPGHSLHRSKQRPASSALQAAPFLLVGNFQAWTWGHQETQNQVLMGLSTGLSGRLRLSANLLIDIKKTSGIWKKKNLLSYGYRITY